MTYTPLSQVVPPPFWPSELLASDSGSFLDRLACLAYDDRGTQDFFNVYVLAKAMSEASIPLPFVGGTELVFGHGGAGDTGLIESDLFLQFFDNAPPVFDLSIATTLLGLRLDRALFKPVQLTLNGNRRTVTVLDGQVAIALPFTLLLRYENEAWGMDFEAPAGGGATGLSIPPTLVGDTGVVVEATNVSLNFSGQGNRPAGAPATWRGLYLGNVKLYVPELFDGVIDVTGMGIGSGGLDGTVNASFPLTFNETGTPRFTGTLAGRVLGVEGGISSVSLRFVQNALVEAAIGAKILLPFFDKPVDVTIAIDAAGDFKIALANASGLTELAITDVLRLSVSSLAFSRENGRLLTRLSGQLTPLYQASTLGWPTLDVEELAIDQDGNVYIEGGWIHLRQKYTLNLYNFRFEITKLGFGRTKDGGKWLGFSGSIKFVDGLSAGASAEGLRITWSSSAGSARLSMEGVGVEFAVPGAVTFEGSVSLKQSPDRFDGSVRLSLPSLKLAFDGKITIGSNAGRPFFALFIDAALPAGMPLGNTGLALYGVAGLFASRMAPARSDGEDWYEWSKRPGGATNLQGNWAFDANGLALGAGITLGTWADNGYAFNGKVLLVISLPGPVILVEGQANVLSERTHLNDGREPIFRMFGVLDVAAGTTLLALDARYKYDAASGSLIDVHGSAEAFFNWNDPLAWHLYLGQEEPRHKRIQAEIFRLFDAEAYLMLRSTELRLGARVGWDAEWKFGPLRVFLEAWLETDSAISWKPGHYHGSIGLHGAAGVKVYGVGLTLSIDTTLSADVFTPYHIAGSFRVKVGLPWPIPDVSASVRMSWGPEKNPPPVPIVVQDVSVEHPKVSTTWRLRRGEFLLPSYDPDGDGYLNAASGPAVPAALASVPVVPLDARPTITFSRPVHDDALVGVNVQSGGKLTPATDSDYEYVGDTKGRTGPVKARYALESVQLQKLVGATWTAVATAPAVANVPPLFGAWAIVPAMSNPNAAQSDQVKLQIYAKTPYFYGRITGEGGGWAAQNLGNPYCLPPPGDVRTCYDFSSMNPNRPLEESWQTADGVMRLSWQYPPPIVVRPPATPGGPPVHALRVAVDPHPSMELLMSFSRPVKKVTLELEEPWEHGFTAIWWNETGQASAPVSFRPPTGVPGPMSIDIVGDGMVRLSVASESEGNELLLRRICVTTGLRADETTRRQTIKDHVTTRVDVWYQNDAVLEPYTTYRVRLVTGVHVRFEGELEGPDKSYSQEEFAYFQTQGPPGFTALSTPVDQQQAQFTSGLEDLRAYVDQTVPATRDPNAGDKPLLPRPVYRAYDVSLLLNANYVVQMFRLAQRDIGLYLFDQNNQPARDLLGRLVTLNASSEAAPTLTLAREEDQWLTNLASGGCFSVDLARVTRDVEIVNHSGYLLAPDSYYEARVVPLLLNEDFADLPANAAASGPSNPLGRWMVLDQTATGGPSSWQLATNALGARMVRQTTNIGATGGALLGAHLVHTGSASLPTAARPANWVDYRVACFVRSPVTTGQVGVFVRQRSAGHYRYVIGPTYRRLESVAANVATVLATEPFTFKADTDYKIVIEALGTSLRVFQDEKLVFSINDANTAAGTFGLYTWRSPGATFQEIRVDDLRTTAPVLYRFQFTTSRFANLFHQMQGGVDRVFRRDLTLATLPDSDLTAFRSAAPTAVKSAVTATEAQRFEDFASRVLGVAEAQRYVKSLTVTQIRRTDAAGVSSVVGLLVQSPEPIDWPRTQRTVQRGTARVGATPVAGAVKLAAAQFGTAAVPNNERITLLALEDVNLTSVRIESRALGSTGAWTLGYTFGPETPLRSGTRVVVHSGNTTAAWTLLPTSIHRFRATGTSTGTLLFPGAGVELRVVGPDGKVWHQRSFAPTYGNFSSRVLRKLDGTACVVFASGANTMSAGAYRLTLTFERGTALSFDKPALSEAGDASNEVVTVDFPYVD